MFFHQGRTLPPYPRPPHDPRHPRANSCPPHLRHEDMAMVRAVHFPPRALSQRDLTITGARQFVQGSRACYRAGVCECSVRVGMVYSLYDHDQSGNTFRMIPFPSPSVKATWSPCPVIPSQPAGFPPSPGGCPLLCRSSELNWRHFRCHPSCLPSKRTHKHLVPTMG